MKNSKTLIQRSGRSRSRQVVMNCASGNLQVTVEISLVGFIIQSNG